MPLNCTLKNSLNDKIYYAMCILPQKKSIKETAWYWENRELLFIGYRVSVWDKKKVLEMNSSYGFKKR